jgi:hypothetical protein
MSRKIVALPEGNYVPGVLIVDINGDPVTGSGGGGPASISDGSDVAMGAKANTAATWYNTTASAIALLKLLVATMVGAGSHVYGYSGGKLITDAWTLLGTTRTKTYTYTGDDLTGESDWV